MIINWRFSLYKIKNMGCVNIQVVGRRMWVFLHFALIQVSGYGKQKVSYSVETAAFEPVLSETSCLIVTPASRSAMCMRVMPHFSVLGEGREFHSIICQEGMCVASSLQPPSSSSPIPDHPLVGLSLFRERLCGVSRFSQSKCFRVRREGPLLEEAGVLVWVGSSAGVGGAYRAGWCLKMNDMLPHL